MTATPPALITNAALEWDADGWPRSTVYGDIYFSRADALGESTHVFLEGNGLPGRWRQLAQDGFTIGELGFGSGLNFLNSCRLWCASAPAFATLHYVACELHPMRLDDLRRLHAHWPQLQEFSMQLCRYYPEHTAGVHQLELRFGQHRVMLTLLYGEAEAMLRSLERPQGWRADAWFLDGFAPSCNPGLWSTSLLRTLARASHGATTLTTYSVAGAFRASLLEAGFSFEKLPGYAGKRHMLRARLAAAPMPSATLQRERLACVVGAGLAGCSTAHALAAGGWKVLLIERAASIAAQASGNAQGILHYRPAMNAARSNEFNLHAYLHAGRLYTLFAATAGLDWQRCGMLQLATSARLQQRFRQQASSGHFAPQLFRYLEAKAASELSGVDLHHPALFFPDSGWLAPPQLCAVYAAHPSITVMTRTEVIALERTSSDWSLCLRTAEGEREQTAGLVVLCNAADVFSFEQTRRYPVICNQGQVDVYPADAASEVDLILCGQGYLLPAANGVQSVGGSFFVGDASAAAIAERRELHLQQLGEVNAELAARLRHREPKAQRTGIRCATPDRMPLVGPVPGHEGLYLNAAHGSHGLTRTPLCAAYVASLVNGTPAPLPNEVAAVIEPGRFGE